MNYSNLEIDLLMYWKSQNIKWLYKYKHRVKECSEEGLTNTELFLDITNGRVFNDIIDIANLDDRSITGNDVKISVDELISKRIK